MRKNNQFNAKNYVQNHKNEFIDIIYQNGNIVTISKEHLDRNKNLQYYNKDKYGRIFNKNQLIIGFKEKEPDNYEFVNKYLEKIEKQEKTEKKIMPKKIAPIIGDSKIIDKGIGLIPLVLQKKIKKSKKPTIQDLKTSFNKIKQKFSKKQKKYVNIFNRIE